MKLIINTQSLQKSLNIINHAVSTRSQLPILLNILLEVKDKSLSLTSTDLEIGITTTFPAEVMSEGAITVPAKTFFELISSLSEKETELELEDNNLFVTTKNSKTSFSTQPADEFPKLYLEKGKNIAEIKGKGLSEDLGPVIFATSIDMSRPVLTGVLLRPEKDGILMVATDGYRLSSKKSKTKIDKLEAPLVVPSRVLRETVNMKDPEKNIEIYIAKEQNQIIFEQEGAVLVGRLIEGEFPAFEKIIPSDESTSITFDREELLKAVKMCSIFARESANIIKMSLKKQSLTVSSQTPSLGENIVTVDAKMTGEENEIAFNARYLLDVLSHIPGEELVFGMTGPLNPGVFRIKGDDTFLHLIMPIRIQG